MTHEEIIEGNTEGNYLTTPLDILSELVFIKQYKDLNGKDKLYQFRQPKAWEAAIYLLKSFEGFKLNIPLGEESRLVRWSNAVAAFYGHHVYMVGSQLQNKVNPRDVDIVCAIPDKEFEIRYGSVEKYLDELKTGMYTDITWRVAADSNKKSLHGMKETKLPIDFKVQPVCQFMGYENIHKVFPPYQIDKMPSQKSSVEIISKIRNI